MPPDLGRHHRGRQPRSGLLLTHDRKVSPRGTFQASRNRWIPMVPNSFGLPAGISCPGKTTFCTACYAVSSERAKGVADNMRHNLDLLLEAATVDGMADLLDEMLDRYRREADRLGLTGDERLFRIHWDGDFYSTDYASAWAQVIPDYPDIAFWCYTRSFTDPVNVVPILADLPNLALYLSVDADNATAAATVSTTHDVMVAYCTPDYQTGRALAATTAPSRRGPTPCPENDARKKVPLMTDGVGACVTCQLCPKERRDIIFATTHSDDATQPVTITRRSSARLIPSVPMARTRDRILDYLRAAGGQIVSPEGRGITKDIADEIGVTSAAITAQFKKLEAEGLIGRTQTGKRLYALYLTEAGAPTIPARPTSAPAHGQSGVTVTRMRCGEMIDRALERTDDPVVVGAFARCEEELAADADELARLKQRIIDQDAALDAAFVYIAEHLEQTA